MNNDDHNDRILSRMRGLKAQPATPESYADPRNPNMRNDNVPAVSDETGRGGRRMSYDTHCSSCGMPYSDFAREGAKSCECHKMAAQAVRDDMMTGKAALSAAPVAQEPVADIERRRFIELMSGPTEEYKSEQWKAKAFELADECDRLERLSRTSPPAPAASVGAEEIAAYLFARDESLPHEGVTPALMDWGRLQVRSGKDAAHDGDCTKKPFSCVRCAYDIAIRDANALLNLPSRREGK